jgi:TonB family protein
MRIVLIPLQLLFICAAVAAPRTEPIALVPPMAAQWGLYIPQPEYPVQARQRRITGSGIFALHVSLRTGLVERLDIEKSTGNRALDTSAIKTLKQWRFNAPAMRRAKDKVDPMDRAKGIRILVPVRFEL